jgi:cytochrome c peroxidase
MKQWVFLLFFGVMQVYSGMLRPLPLSVDADEAKVKLGEILFFDPRLSKDGTVSCAHCHDLLRGGADGRKVSIGIGGRSGIVNAPTVYNAVFNFRQFWDGRAKDLQEQAAGPITNPNEMGYDFDHLVVRLKRIPMYRRHFANLYSDGITQANITHAIAEYEKTLITPHSPFDVYLRGKRDAISVQAKEGYRLFVSKGCIICHNGANIGGNLYNRFGIYKETHSASLGRYSVTQRDEDKYVFKVPSLRNVALTAPYMHDGRFSTLKKAVEFMSEYQLGRHIVGSEIDAIVAFLKSLTGKLPGSVLNRP